MQLKATIRGKTYAFSSVKEVLGKSNPPKSGDDLAGVSAREAVERVAARAVLSGLTLAELRESPAVPYEEDELTSLVEYSLDPQAFAAIRELTVGQLREWLLEPGTTGALIRSISPGLTHEMAAAVCMLMSNLDLMVAGARCETHRHCTEVAVADATPGEGRRTGDTLARRPMLSTSAVHVELRVVPSLIKRRPPGYRNTVSVSYSPWNGLSGSMRICQAAAACVVGPSGMRLRTEVLETEVLETEVLETEGGALVQFVRSVRGTRRLCMEEGTMSEWTCEVLSPHVEELVVLGIPPGTTIIQPT